MQRCLVLDKRIASRFLAQRSLTADKATHRLVRQARFTSMQARRQLPPAFFRGFAHESIASSRCPGWQAPRPRPRARGLTMASRLVTIDELVAALGGEHPPALLDVRDLIESERGHIPGATIVPRRRIEFRIESLVRDRATPLIVVDSGEDVDDGARDPRATLAGETLSAFGYRDVSTLDGGVAAWRHAGLPIVSGTQVSSKAFGRRIGDLERVPSVDVPTLRRWLDEGRRVALCDVRSAEEHTEGCIPGAVSLPGFEIVSHALDMAAESDVIVLCSSARTRSLIVARTLIDLGLSDVMTLDGGALAWRLAGHELEQGSRRRRVRPSKPARQFAELGSARLAKHFGVERIEAGGTPGPPFSARGDL